jgi:RHS repeat-associated protein
MNVPGDRDIKYSYDEMHNRTYMQHGFGHITYNYDEKGMNFLQSYTEDSGLTVKYNYDKQGNPTQKKYADIRTMPEREVARENYTWNDRDELTQITGRVTESYTYDYRGLRHIKDSDGNKYKYIYLQNNQPVFKYDVTNNVYDVFIYEGRNRVARMRFDSAHRPETEILLNNYQGSVMVVLSSTGNIQYQKYLDPWGNLEMETGYIDNDIDFQYTDKEYDKRLGLYYFQARYMDPRVGFLGRDRVHLEDNLKNYFGLNPYVFVNNNPITNYDPDGNIPYQQTVSALLRNQMNYGARWRNPANNSDVSKVPVSGWDLTNHKGVDLAASLGTNVNAGASGKVVFAGKAGNAGNMIRIEHELGYTTEYMHLKDDSFKVGVGDYVQNGQNIAEVGNTGTSSGSHLHYQINKNDKNISPYIDLQVTIDIEKFNLKIDTLGVFTTQSVPQSNVVTE